VSGLLAVPFKHVFNPDLKKTCDPKGPLKAWGVMALFYGNHCLAADAYMSLHAPAQKVEGAQYFYEFREADHQ